MASAKVFLIPFLATSLFLVGCHMKHTSAAEGAPAAWGKESEGLRCAVSTVTNRWHEGAPAIVSVVFENRSDKKIEFQTIPSFDLSDAFWCPVELSSEGRSLDANARSPLSLDKGATLELRFDLSQLGWDESVSSAWPEEKLYSAVPPGSYKLRLDVQLTGGERPKWLRSNEVAVSIVE